MSLVDWILKCELLCIHYNVVSALGPDVLGCPLALRRYVLVHQRA